MFHEYFELNGFFVLSWSELKKIQLESAIRFVFGSGRIEDIKLQMFSSERSEVAVVTSTVSFL